MENSYHLIGIGGIGMSALARLLLSQKMIVTGSDIAFNATIEKLIQEGAVIYRGHSEDHISANSTVIYSSDIKMDNPEYIAAVRMNCTLLHRSDLLEDLLRGYRAIAVAGTHGKTTTTSLLATVLFDAQLDPSFAIGGLLPAFQSNARYGKGEYFVFEADESDRTFLRYHPYGAIITNIDNDHLNNYEGNLQLLIDSFYQFMTQVQSTNHLFWCFDDDKLLQLNFPGQSYGFHPKSDWKITSMRQEEFMMVFDLEHKGKSFKDIEIALTGKHNVLNSTAVFGLSLSLGVSESSIRETFKSFKGVLRRCEKKGEINKILFLDDYAHHPTEIQTTLEGIRKATFPRRLIAIFQPHRYTRTQDCLGQFGKIFESVDEVILTDIYGAGETPIPHLSHQNILEEVIDQSTVSCQYVPRSALSHYVSQVAKPHDVFVSLGAGDVTKLGSETLSLLENFSAPSLKVGIIWDCESFHYDKNIHSQQSAHLHFTHFGLTQEGFWLEEEQMLEKFQNSAFEIKLSEFISPSIFKKILDCEVILPLLNSQQALSIFAFLDVIGKPYIKISDEELRKGRDIQKDALTALHHQRIKMRRRKGVLKVHV